MLGESVLGADNLRDRPGDESRITHRLEPDPEHPRPVVRHDTRRGLDREPRLPRPAGARQRQQPTPFRQPGEDLRQLILPTDERARQAREVAVRNRLQRRKRTIPELKDRHRAVDVLQPMLTEITKHQPVARRDQRRRRSRQEDLTAVARRGDPCHQVDVVTHVPLARHQWRSRVQADAYMNRTSCEPRRQLAGGCQGTRSGRKRDKTGVTLRAHLHSAVLSARLPNDTPMLAERIRVALRTELAQQPRRTLDVREQERHGPSRQLDSHGTQHRIPPIRGLNRIP